MDGNFVKINFENAISSKKENLIAQLQATYIREHIKNFVRLKKQEIVIKRKIKEDLNLVKNKIKIINNLFPHDKYSPKIQKTRTEYIIKETNIRKRSSIEEELLRIKHDLEILEHKR